MAENNPVSLYGKKSVNEMNKDKGKRLFITALRDRAEIYGLIGKYEKAIEEYEKILRICKKSDPSIRAELILRISALLVTGRSDLKGARRLICKLQKFSGTKNSPSFQARILNMLGIICRRELNYVQAEKYFQKALNIYKKLKDNYAMNAVLSNIALLAFNRDEYDNALHYYNKCLFLDKKINDKLGMATTFNNIGLVYQEIGDYEKAIEYYNKSLMAAEKTGYRMGAGTALGNCGAVFEKQGDYSKAIEYYKKNFQIAKELGFRRQLGISSGLLGKVFINNGEYTQALKFSKIAFTIFQELNDINRMTLAQIHLGITYTKLRQYAKAGVHLYRAEQNAMKMNDKKLLSLVKSAIFDLEKNKK
ncbi:MAG: tetratricopeptide repeat protein [candidate division WOR-3 bacterium]